MFFFNFKSSIFKFSKFKIQFFEIHNFIFVIFSETHNFHFRDFSEIQKLFLIFTFFSEVHIFLWWFSDRFLSSTQVAVVSLGLQRLCGHRPGAVAAAAATLRGNTLGPKGPPKIGQPFWPILVVETLA